MNINIDTITAELKQAQSEKDWLESQLKAWIKTAQNLQEQSQQQSNQSSIVPTEKEEDLELSQSELYQTQKQLRLTELQLHQTQEELELSQSELSQTQKQLRLTELQLHQTQEELEQFQMSQAGATLKEETHSIKESTANTKTKITDENKTETKPIASKTANSSESVLENYQDYIKLGNKFRKEGEIDKAITYFLKAIQFNPQEYQGYSSVKNIIQKKTCSANALSEINQVCQNIIEANSKRTPAYLLLARSLTEQGQIEKSIECYQQGIYQKTLKLKPEYVQTSWDSGKWQGPSYIVIGAPKCATTSLDKYLEKHPQILPSIVKESGYFSSRLSQQKIDYYFSHFPPTPEDRSLISGDADPNYFYKQDVPGKIFAALPNIKLILMLRNPIDRTISYYHHAVRLGRETRSLETVINSELENFKKIEKFNLQIFDQKLTGRYLSQALYVFFLEKWLSIFTKEQLLILRTEDLKEDPAEFMNTVFSFLELSKHSFVFDKKHNTGSYDPLSPELRNRLSEFFQPYNQKLEEYLGRKFDWE